MGCSSSSGGEGGKKVSPEGHGRRNCRYAVAEIGRAHV